MQDRDPKAWMLAQAIELLNAAERLQRQFFHVGVSGGVPVWEPPIDMYADASGLGVWVALPGVAPHLLEVVVESSSIVVRGARTLAAALSAGSILRLEIPYGSFERRIALPKGDYQMVEMELEHGCLRLYLKRMK
jgi:HSP20 family protein